MPKNATLETGAEVRVPLFIGIGEKITIDTRDGFTKGVPRSNRTNPLITLKGELPRRNNR